MIPSDSCPNCKKKHFNWASGASETMQFRQRKAFRALLKYKNNHTLSQGGLDIGLKVGILAEIGYMLQECALM